MNFIKTTFLFYVLFLANYMHATGNNSQTSDDLQKRICKLNLTGTQTTQSISRTPKRTIMLTERSHDYDTEIILYSNGDWEKVSFVGSQGTREIHRHNTRETTIEIVSRNQQS